MKKIIFLHIAGDPILRQIAPEVPKDKIKSNEIKTLISQMKNVLHAYNLVGIAAPQIGVSYRIICMESPEQLKERYPAAVYKTRQMDILPMTVSKMIYITHVMNYRILFSFDSPDSHQSGTECDKFQYKNVPRGLWQCLWLYC